VKHTLFEAIVLVALVVLVFLQSWRASLIPIIAIPVSLVGTFAVLAAFGYSLNNLSLFGLVLAIGIVVDDAIVVVENIERLMEQGLSARDAAHETMDEVSGALIAIALVLIGVFLPTTFIPGISGQFFKQFALTIISATAFSAFVSLTLSPAMASLILRHKSHAAPAAGWRGGPPGVPGASMPPLTGLAHAMAATPYGAARVDGGGGLLCGSDRTHRLALCRNANRLHPGSGSGLSDRHHPTARRCFWSIVPTPC
jgi:multidrug efflux pump subunit AcrB